MSPGKLLIFTSIISIFLFATPAASQMMSQQYYNNASYKCQQCMKNVENCWKSQECMRGNVKTASQSGKCSSMEDICTRFCMRTSARRTLNSRSMGWSDIWY